MTVTVRKAGQAVATKLRAAGGRAVTAAEAPSVEPARKSTTNTSATMMPWRGWFQRWLQDNISPTKFATFRAWTNFMPDDIYDLQQSPKPSQKIPISRDSPDNNTNKKQTSVMYRYPSPGSQKPASIPEFDTHEDPYDSGYFKRDTRRRYEDEGNPAVEQAKLALLMRDYDHSNDPAAVQEEMEKIKAGPASSPGNKGVFATGPSDFDPTGLRATMSVSWDALNKSLDEHMPDHLPRATWEGKEAEIIQWYEERDLPVPVGAYYQALKVPTERRVARW